MIKTMDGLCLRYMTGLNFKMNSVKMMAMSKRKILNRMRSRRMTKRKRRTSSSLSAYGNI